jgi:hypothetical protein
MNQWTVLPSLVPIGPLVWEKKINVKGLEDDYKCKVVIKHCKYPTEGIIISSNITWSCGDISEKLIIVC